MHPHAGIMSKRAASAALSSLLAMARGHRRHLPLAYGAQAVGVRCRNLDGHTRSGQPDRDETSLSGCDNNRFISLKHDGLLVAATAPG